MSINEKYKHSDLTSKIIGCAMEVHNHLGNGFQEVIYQRALAIEFEIQDIAFQREMEMSLSYKGRHVGTRRVDFFVDEKVMVELKANETIPGLITLEGLWQNKPVSVPVPDSVFQNRTTLIHLLKMSI